MSPVQCNYKPELKASAALGKFGSNYVISDIKLDLILICCPRVSLDGSVLH